MTCQHILFLVSLMAFVGVVVYGLVITGQRRKDADLPPIVDPWAMTGRRITDAKLVKYHAYL